MISCPFVLAATLLLSPASVEAQAPSTTTIEWSGLFSSVSVKGAEYSPAVKALQGKRVRLRGWAVVEPVPPGGLFLTRVPSERLHPDDEETLPWESAIVVWKEGIAVPPVPARPTVEGTLRLGNRRVGAENVILTLEDAVPVVAPGAPSSASR
jgi:hypothetical protein